MRKKLKKFFEILMGFIFTIGILGMIFMYLVFYSNYKPFENLRELWVTTAMRTFHHQWLATEFISQAEIDRIMNNNKVIETSEVTDTNEVKIDNTDNKEEEIEKEKDRQKIDVVEINENGYKGKLLIVHDPKRIELGVINHLGDNDERGLTLKEMIQKYDALGGVNAGGYADEGGCGNGSTPTGIVVKDGKVLYKSDEPRFNIVGFNYSNKLITGSYSLEDIKTNSIKDAVSFGPALIINGKPTEMVGNGGWGIQPRTAIGQTSTGEVLLLEIDGRQPASVGASLKDMQNILLRYNAFNASNLDGGSSTVMYYDGKMINKPCGPMGSTGGRYMPTSFLIKK